MLIGMKRDILDKFDSDAWADGYADMLGVDPKLVVSGETVARIRQQRAQAQQQMAKQEAEAQAVENATKLNNSKRGTESSMLDMLNQYSGYNSPSPLEV